MNMNLTWHIHILNDRMAITVMNHSTGHMDGVITMIILRAHLTHLNDFIAMITYENLVKVRMDDHITMTTTMTHVTTIVDIIIIAPTTDDLDPVLTRGITQIVVTRVLIIMETEQQHTIAAVLLLPTQHAVSLRREIDSRVGKILFSNSI